MHPRFEMRFTNPLLAEGRVPVPCFATEQSAGMDLCSTESIILFPGDQKMLGAGFAVWIKDPQFAAIIAPRSGLGSDGLIIGNTVGLIDADYQGEIMICLLNRSKTRKFVIELGDRIAQMFFVRVNQPKFQIVEEFSSTTKRGTGGIGHTGVKNVRK